MEITINSVREVKDGWIINNERFVPSYATDDPYHIAIQDWITAGNTPDPLYATPEEELAAKKAEVMETIRKQFEATAKQPVTVGTVDYDGGYDSAMKLDAAKRLAELAGNTSVVFYDVSNQPHDLAIAEAEAVILAIGAAYQTAFADKQAKLTQAQQATTLAELPVV